MRLAWGIPGARHYAHVHGDQDPDVRESERHRFQHDPECGVLLAMIDVNKESVNLTAGNHVILLDPWWNPMLEWQAVKRIEGMQQTKQVHRYRLIMQDSVETRMARRADSKIQMDKDAFPSTLVVDEAIMEEESTTEALQEMMERLDMTES